MDTNEQSRTSKAFCNNCHRPTTHRIVASHVTTHEVEYTSAIGDGVELWEITSDMLVCAGCDFACLRDVIVDESGDRTVLQHPPRTARLRPTLLSHVPEDIRALMGEVYLALDSDARRLALMGARAVLDMLLVEQVGDVGSFGQKLQALESQGLVSKSGRQVLSAALEAGNAVSHRGILPSVEDTNAVLDIVEYVLQATYQLGALARRLRRSTPPRGGVSSSPNLTKRPV